mmetsp:Transcript_17521/g.30804  ORF Transcript_17521/g.30804 Transcript_17521/m.30804 type:complete len:85 (-) Transcript_17521:742-996(-)
MSVGTEEKHGFQRIHISVASRVVRWVLARLRDRTFRVCACHHILFSMIRLEHAVQWHNYGSTSTAVTLEALMATQTVGLFIMVA